MLALLTHWGRVTHICISKLNIIGSDNGLSPGWRQAIIWTNTGILLTGPLGTKLEWNLNRNVYIFINKYFWKCHLKMAVILWWPQCVKWWIVPCREKICHRILMYCSRACFTHNFPIHCLTVLKKFPFVLTQLLTESSLQNFAHCTTATLS